MSATVSVRVPPVPVRTPFRFTPPASTQTRFAPMLEIAVRTWADAPSPIAIVQITALTPMMTPEHRQHGPHEMTPKRLQASGRPSTSCIIAVPDPATAWSAGARIALDDHQGERPREHRGVPCHSRRAVVQNFAADEKEAMRHRIEPHVARPLRRLQRLDDVVLSGLS